MFAYDDGSQDAHSPLVVLVLPRVVDSDAELYRAIGLVGDAARKRDPTGAYR
jgi:hypothetical protein